MNLPTNWKEVELKNYFSRLTRKNDEENTNVLTISAQHGLISQQEFFNKSIASEDKSNYFLLERGDFAYNKSYSAGYPFGVVKSLEKYDKGIVSPLYICFKRTIENKCPDYFLQYFEAGSANKEICSVAQEGARNHGLLNISTEDFFKIKIVVPPLAEQLKIAEILCKQDKIISLKQKLLEQKLQQKKWLMQKLLEVPHTNVNCEEKISLGGVVINKSEWKRDSLGNLGVFSKGSGIKREEANSGKIPAIRYGEIYTVHNEYIKIFYSFISNDVAKQSKLLKNGDLLFSCSGETKEDIGKCVAFVFNCEAYAGGDVIILSPKVTIDSMFFGFFLNSTFVNKQRFEFAQGDSIVHISSESLSKIKIYLPSLPEQKIIAQVLSTADKEIALLKSSIEQEKQKKKSLAQLLLTGTVRVKT